MGKVFAAPVPARAKTQSPTAIQTGVMALRRPVQDGLEGSRDLVAAGQDTRPSKVHYQWMLSVGPVNDPLEREADRAADLVMRMSEPTPVVSRSGEALRRKCAQCDEPEGELRAKAETGSAPHEAPADLMAGLGSGSPLDHTTRSFMEPRFGHDFGQVRVHDNAAADRAARSVHALAFTAGRDIVFRAGTYLPGSVDGRKLLAHELAHTVQQGHHAPSTKVGQRLPAHELTHVMHHRGNTDAGVVQRQGTNPPPPNPNPNPPQPAAPVFDCLQDGTNQEMPIAANTVTVIEYGADWCGPCKVLKQDLNDLCKSYKTTKTAVPVRFFAADYTDTDKKPVEKTWPPLPGSGVPKLLIYSGQFQTYAKPEGLQTPTKAEIKVQVDKAVGCAKDPLKCAIVPTDCAITPITTTTPAGTRFKFNVSTVDWASGELTKIEAFAKGLKAGSTVNILGMASSDGPDSMNQILSCHRASVAQAVFLRNGITADAGSPIRGSGPVPGTDNKPEYRGVDIEVTAPATPSPQVPGTTPQTTAGACTAPACVADYIISGPTVIQKPALSKTEPDPVKRKQAGDCNPSLFQVVPNPSNLGVTKNNKIVHVKWKKDPPANTLSVTRNALDNDGDAPVGKAPSFASLDPTTDPKWKGRLSGLKYEKFCGATVAAPSWCVPFCSFGTFTMVATVSWQCGTTICTNDIQTKAITIELQEKP
jgi:outer membrane protein OmpA-like peptidoglycan-associated protein